MNYSKIYNDLVAKALPRGTDKSILDGYFELHHIIPRCMGGSNDKSNLVMFTGREHFIAHKLLWKAFPQEVSLMRAAHMMASRWQADVGYKSNSKVYQKLREEYAEAVRVQCTGEGNPFFGKKHSQETLDLIKKTRLVDTAKKRLLNWKSNNGKIQKIKNLSPKFDFSVIPKYVEPTIESFRHRGDIQDWLAFQVYKDFWERCEKPGKKLFCSCVNEVSGSSHNGSYFNTMVERFQEDWNPEDNPGFIIKALNSNSDKYIADLEEALSKTPSQIKEEFKHRWFDNREFIRDIIQTVTKDIKASEQASQIKLGDIDVAEAILLWESGKVDQILISGLYGVARNTICNVMTRSGWLHVKEVLPKIKEKLYTNPQWIEIWEGYERI